MFRTAIALATALAATSASAGLITNANDVTLRMTGFAHGYAAVDTSANAGYIGAGELAGLMIADDGTETPFLTYCTDIFQSFGWQTDYQYTRVANGSATGLSHRQADLLGKLYTLAGRDVDTVDESTAFQLAVWEVVTENGPALGVRGGSFRLERGASNAQRNLADSWLAAVLDIRAESLFSAQRLFNPLVQDFVVFTEIPALQAGLNANGTVPEPATYGLAGLALAGLVWSRRRRA